MVSLTIFKNKKAFSLIELLVAMIIASIVMFSVYFMLIIVYDQFNDLTEESERFNNLQVFERMFQRSAMTCSNYKIDTATSNDKKFCFYELKDKKYEIYEFKGISADNFVNISTDSETAKAPIYSGRNPADIGAGSKLIYYSNDTDTAVIPTYTRGYSKKTFSPAYDDIDDNEKVLFDNIVKVYYETSNKIKSSDDFKKLTGKDLENLNMKHEKWLTTGAYYKTYTPFIKLIIFYKDKKNKIKRAYITCRLRNIEGTENIKI